MQKKAIENAIKRTRETQAVRENTNSKNSENAKLKKTYITSIVLKIDIISPRQNVEHTVPLSTLVGAHNRCRKSFYYIGWSNNWCNK